MTIEQPCFAETAEYKLKSIELVPALVILACLASAVH